MIRRWILIPVLLLVTWGMHGCGRAIDQAITNGIFDSNTSYPIDDNQTIDAPIAVTTAITSLQDIRLTIYIQHPRIGDLKLSLLSPSGETILLSDRNGGKSAVMQLHFADSNPQKVTEIPCPIADGYYQPEEPLATFTGSDPNGTWHLKITDTVANGTHGTLKSWLMMIR